MSNMRYSLGAKLTGEATTGQKVMVRRLLQTEQGIANLCKYLDKQTASTIIERAKGIL